MFLRALVVVVLLCSLAYGATFESMTYTPPKGWKSATGAGGVQLQIVDEKAKTFALIAVTTSVASSGSLDKDFDLAWATTVATTFGTTGAPQTQAGDSENGWTSKVGTAPGKAGGMDATVILVTITGHGRSMNLVISTNSDRYQKAIEGFLSSVKMAAVKGAPAPSAPAVASKGATSTTFDDGWTATLEAYWVRVTRAGGITVLLHYGIAHDDTTRNDTTNALWTKLVAPRFSLADVQTFDNRNSPGLNRYFRTATATDRSTGARSFVALELVSESGIAYGIEVHAPSREAFTKQFPT